MGAPFVCWPPADAFRSVERDRLRIVRRELARSKAVAKDATDDADTESVDNWRVWPGRCEFGGGETVVGGEDTSEARRGEDDRRPCGTLIDAIEALLLLRPDARLCARVCCDRVEPDDPLEPREFRLGDNEMRLIVDAREAFETFDNRAFEFVRGLVVEVVVAEDALGLRSRFILIVPMALSSKKRL